MTTCAFEAQSGDKSAQGLAIHNGPSAAASVLGHIRGVEVEGQGLVGAKFHVLGALDGWLLIESATAKGWVDGRSATTHLYRETLKAAASHSAPDVAKLIETDAAGFIHEPYDVPVRRIVDCSGPWLEVEIRQPGVKAPSKQLAARDRTVVGWTDRSCADQRGEGQCKSRQFDYPWSPLPSGITECDFAAFSGDPDPAGLNVRAEPDRNARILGRLPPPNGSDPSDQYLSRVDVIGYKKGWFLVEGGNVDDLSDLSGPHAWKFRPYTGRGWVASNLLTAQLGSQLKQAPSGVSAEVVHILDYQSVWARRILACSGAWLHIEIALPRDTKLLTKTDAPPGAARGWVDGTCASQKTTCDFGGKEWSPPAPSPPE